jgi:hypothetical protein
LFLYFVLRIFFNFFAPLQKFYGVDSSIKGSRNSARCKISRDGEEEREERN